MKEPPWIEVARKYLGLREIPGKQHHPMILRWLKEGGVWWADDEQPWCGTFIYAVIQETNALRPELNLPIPPKHWYRAREWANWGWGFPAPTLGAIVVFNGGAKRPAGGHVGICVGRDEQWRPMILGGNQGNAVSIAPFDPSRIIATRYPFGNALEWGLPVLAANGAPVSSNEA
jgi:uncharacterized protein (TIGR02594 family)